MNAIAASASDTLVIARRNLERIPRQPDLLTAYTIQPVMFVLLSSTCSAARSDAGPYDYVDFLMPGIIVQSIAFGGFVTALGLSDDVRKGLIDRFRSLPMSRAAVLAGRTLSDVALNCLSLVVLFSVGLHRRVQLHRRERGRHRARDRARAAARLRVLVGVRAGRAVLVLPGDGERARLHGALPADIRVVDLRARGARCPTGCVSSRRRTPSRPGPTRRARSGSEPPPTPTCGCRSCGASC